MDDEKGVAIVHYMEVTAPLDGREKNLGCICVRWSTFDKMDHSVCGKEHKRDVVTVEEWYGLETLSSVVGSGHLARLNPALLPLTTEWQWSHHRFYMNRLYVDSSGQNITGAVDLCA